MEKEGTCLGPKEQQQDLNPGLQPAALTVTRPLLHFGEKVVGTAALPLPPRKLICCCGSGGAASSAPEVDVLRLVEGAAAPEVVLSGGGGAASFPLMSGSRRRSRGRAGRDGPGAPEGGSPRTEPALCSLTVTDALHSAEDSVPRAFRSFLVQMGLNSMKSANICIGRPVLLTSTEGRREVCTAWPVSGFPMGKVGLSTMTQKSLQVKPGAGVLAQPLTAAVLQAEEVDLSLRRRDDCINTEELAAFLLRH
ncbi:ATPase family protein 2 homolog, partial [Rhinatrema bivittatum]|uniref:ATPase family protein 2 homolog n=1 Tax=Rhinatrema bivittatum TaxID=194408 RepID=UPI001125B5FB